MRDEDNEIIDSALESLAYQRKCIDAQVIVIAELREELKTVREQERAALDACGLEIRGKANDD